MVGGLLSAGMTGFAAAACGEGGATQPFPTRDGTFATAGSIDVQLDCGDLTVATRQRRRLAGRGP